MIWRAAILGLGLSALAACSTAPEASRAPPPVAPAPPPPPSSPAPVADTCNAGAHQHLVGRPRSEIPVPVKPELQRVACTTCPVTMDFNAQRLNFFFDAASGLITEVRCG
jgi:hypothetical protein